MAYCTAIIVAAGSSTRMGIPKLLIELNGVSVLERTLRAFDASKADAMVVVTREEDTERFKALAASLSTPCCFVKGGASRQQSVKNGLAAVAEDTTLIAVADGARPLITPEEIDRVIDTASRTKAAAAAVRVKDTIKQADEHGVIVSTPDRSKLWQVQTPQVFEAALYRAAMASAEEQGLDLTDDCQLAEHVGAAVTLVETSYENLKITTPEDVVTAEAILKKRGGITMRVGHGYDVHRLAEDRKLILGGVEVPFEKGLLGHSDADVLTHAVMDSLLGAAAMGDIGGLFPDTDPAYAGADSMALLREVVARVTQKGYRIENIDATVLCQRPKLKPFIPAMRETIAAACGVAIDCVNIKATTEEGLGFTGAMEGIAAHAVCLIG